MIDCFSDAFDLVGQSRLITSLFLVVTGMHDDLVVRNDFFAGEHLATLLIGNIEVQLAVNMKSMYHVNLVSLCYNEECLKR